MGLDASDGSVIFAFLIIFLGMFGLFLFGGLAWHYIRARRTAALVDALSRYEHARHWHEGAPVMRDIRVYSLEMELKETGENVVRELDALVRMVGLLFVHVANTCATTS
jgi:hypothetical protein